METDVHARNFANDSGSVDSERMTCGVTCRSLSTWARSPNATAIMVSALASCRAMIAFAGALRLQAGQHEDAQVKVTPRWDMAQLPAVD